jgi:hypothetical protein
MSNNKDYIYKQNPIELIINNKDSLELSIEALKLLSSLKNQKILVLSISGLCKTGKTSIANYLISNQNGFDFQKGTKGLWIWGTPIQITNDIKLLILDCEGIKDNKMNNYNLLSLLISTYFIYNTKGDVNDDIINNFINHMNIKDLVSFNNKYHLPEVIFTNDVLTEDMIKNKIENNGLYIKEDIKSLYKSLKYLQLNNIQNLFSNINLDNIAFDGEILFGLIQNYINCINHDEKINADLSLENILLYKSKKECDNIFEEYKNELYKKIEYPTTITNIHKIYNELQNNYITSFCKKIDKILTPVQSGEYINQLNQNMEKEINDIINKNMEYYENYFLLQFSEFEKNLKTEENFVNLDNFHNFVSNYCGLFDSCLQKFFNLFLNSDNSNKVFVNVLIKLYQEFIVNKFIKISQKVNEVYDSDKNKYIEEINSLKNNLNKLKEQMNNTNILMEEKNKEKSSINKNYFELETKFDKFNREYKLKIKESENNINIEIQKYKKMENYYLAQLKEKETLIRNLENKIEKCNQDILNMNKENTIKINEFNRENNRLLNEIERIKDLKNRNKTDFLGSDKNINIPSILKSVNKSFLEFKESVDNLTKENDNLQKNKYLEISRQEIENKLNTVLNDVTNFCNLQIKNLSENYEKMIKKIKNDYEELNFELSKKNFQQNELMLLKETYEKKFNESNVSINNLKSIIKDKDNLIATQKSAFDVYEKRIYDSEMKMAEYIVNFKLKEDEYDSLFIIFDCIISRKKDRFEHELSKLTPDVQKYLKNLIKMYKFFK